MSRPPPPAWIWLRLHPPDFDFNNERRTGITAEKNATKVHMIGGVYKGRGDIHDGQRVRLLNFVWCTDCRFENMLVEDASDDCFTLGSKSRGNKVIGVTARWAGGKKARNGGNGLSDYGRENTWIDCVAEHNGSDGWTPKSQDSTFQRCYAHNTDGPGFGAYARLDGSSMSRPLGTSPAGPASLGQRDK